MREREEVQEVLFGSKIMTLAAKLQKLLRRLSWRGWKIRPIVKVIDPRNDPHYLHRRVGK